MKQLSIIEAPTFNGDAIITPDGVRLKQELLFRLEQLQEINSIETRDDAATLASDIRTHLKRVEENRKRAKEPFLQIGRIIDEIARQHILELDRSIKSLSIKIGHYNAEEIRKVREEEERIREESLKAEQERQKSLAEQEAIENKLADDQPTLDLDAALDLEDEINKAKKREQAAISRQEQIILAIKENAERIKDAKGHGGSNREEISIKIVDIKKLYSQYPRCVRLEPDMIEIKYQIRNGTIFDTDVIEVTRTQIFSARSK